LMYRIPTVLNVERLFFDVKLQCFGWDPINLELNTSRRIQYKMWCCDALSCVTTKLAASGLTFPSCVPSSFARTPRSWEWHSTELDGTIPKKGGSGPTTCIFGVWDDCRVLWPSHIQPKMYQNSLTSRHNLWTQ
jgi:hypothetical protein